MPDSIFCRIIEKRILIFSSFFLNQESQINVLMSYEDVAGNLLNEAPLGQYLVAERNDIIVLDKLCVIFETEEAQFRICHLEFLPDSECDAKLLSWFVLVARHL
jgi:hypothetical protein